MHDFCTYRMQSHDAVANQFLQLVTFSTYAWNKKCTHSAICNCMSNSYMCKIGLKAEYTIMHIILYNMAFAETIELHEQHAVILWCASESGNCTSWRIGTDVTFQWLPDISTQSRVFISGSEIQGMVTYIPVGGGAVEMAVGGKIGEKLKCRWSRGSWVVQWIKHSMQ